MAMPEGIGIVDTMIDFPMADKAATYQFLQKGLRDSESRETFTMPAQYMFKDVPDEAPPEADPVALLLDEMDRWGIETGLVGAHRDTGARALRDHPDRFVGCISVDGNEGMKAVEAIVAAYETHGIRAVTTFPAGTNPQIAINHKYWFPIYAKCAELGLPVFVCAGVPGPRVPFEPQKVEYLDEVCWYFPELTVVTRHGCQPWEDLAVKLMLKWPNLHYSTSAFAPRYYPKAIIDFANTRGADKVLYAGYFPMGLPLERIVTELRDVPLRDEVWPKFLRDNARRILKLD